MAKAISKSKNPGLAKLAKKKPELAKRFGYDPKRMMNIAGKMSVPVDVNANPREIDAIVKSYGIDTRADNFGLPKPKASMMASPNLNTGAFDIGFKDGGKVVKGETTKKAKKKIGIQIRGFGKARKK